MAARRCASTSSGTARRMLRFGMSISIRSPSSTSPTSPPSAASGERWPMERPEEPPEKRPSVDQGASLPEANRLQVAGGVEHLLHARAALRPLVAHQHHVAGLDLLAGDALHRR